MVTRLKPGALCRLTDDAAYFDASTYLGRPKGGLRKGDLVVFIKQSFLKKELPKDIAFDAYEWATVVSRVGVVSISFSQIEQVTL